MADKLKTTLPSFPCAKYSHMTKFEFSKKISESNEYNAESSSLRSGVNSLSSTSLALAGMWMQLRVLPEHLPMSQWPGDADQHWILQTSCGPHRLQCIVSEKYTSSLLRSWGAEFQQQNCAPTSWKEENQEKTQERSVTVVGEEGSLWRWD